MTPATREAWKICDRVDPLAGPLARLLLEPGLPGARAARRVHAPLRPQEAPPTLAAQIAPALQAR